MDKTIGIIGLGIMGGAFARHLAAGGLEGDRLRHRCGAQPRERRRRASRSPHSAEAVAEAASDDHHQPADAARRARHGARHRRSQGPGPHRGRGQHARARRQARRSSASWRRPATPRSIARCRAPARRPRSRTSWSTPAAIPPPSRGSSRRSPASRARSGTSGAYGNGSKMKFVANHLVAIHNVAAAEAMVLRHEGRPRSAPGGGGDRLGRRHLAHVRAARADDGRQTPICRPPCARRPGRRTWR